MPPFSLRKFSMLGNIHKDTRINVIKKQK
jgi:hypothetical protein